MAVIGERQWPEMKGVELYAQIEGWPACRRRRFGIDPRTIAPAHGSGVVCWSAT